MPELIAQRVHDDSCFSIEPAPRRRQWMEDTPQHFANRCLPMMIANQAGWVISMRHKVVATWMGGEMLSDLIVESTHDHAKSHFGSGILTYNVPWLFRTSPGWNLHVKGPSNWPKRGATALEGIVETDWAEATYTVNWKMTEPGFSVVFEVGEPIAMICPVRRDDVESVEPSLCELADREAFDEWARSRLDFNERLAQNEPVAVKEKWQRTYFIAKAEGHQTVLKLKDFANSAG